MQSSILLEGEPRTQLGPFYRLLNVLDFADLEEVESLEQALELEQGVDIQSDLRKVAQHTQTPFSVLLLDHHIVHGQRQIDSVTQNGYSCPTKGQQQDLATGVEHPYRVHLDFDQSLGRGFWLEDWLV